MRFQKKQKINLDFFFLRNWGFKKKKFFDFKKLKLSFFIEIEISSKKYFYFLLEIEISDKTAKNQKKKLRFFCFKETEVSKNNTFLRFLKKKWDF